jgi:hypothetical protein
VLVTSNQEAAKLSGSSKECDTSVLHTCFESFVRRHSVFRQCVRTPARCQQRIPMVSAGHSAIRQQILPGSSKGMCIHQCYIPAVESFCDHRLSGGAVYTCCATTARFCMVSAGHSAIRKQQSSSGSSKKMIHQCCIPSEWAFGDLVSQVQAYLACCATTANTCMVNAGPQQPSNQSLPVASKECDTSVHVCC